MVKESSVSNQAISVLHLKNQNESFLQSAKSLINDHIREEMEERSQLEGEEDDDDDEEYEEEEAVVERDEEDYPWLKKKKKKSQVCLEVYVEREEESQSEEFPRTKSLTDDDLDELKGCLDLGFGFNYNEIPELCNTLPALELCYSMNQRLMDDQHKVPEASSLSEPETIPIFNWKISSPGDHPEEVKARLKFWAQAVACTVRLCSQLCT